MDRIIQFIEQLSKVLTWPVLILILSLFFKGQFRDLLNVLKSRLNTAESIELTKDGVKIKQKLEQLESTLKGAINSGPMSVKPKKIVKIEMVKDKDHDDTLKNSFSGNLRDKNRQITAQVESLENTSLYKIMIKVSSTNPQSDPLKGKVEFFLHPSFPNNQPIIEVINGEAILPLLSYGSFTLGAYTDDGAHLKLDLAKDVEGVSEHFKNT